MGSALDDAPLFHDHDAVGILDRGEPVGDYEACPAVHQGIHSTLDQDFCSGIDRGCGFIQNQGRWISDCSSCDCNQLSLTLAEVGSVVSEDRVVAVWKPADETVGICKLGSPYALFVSGIELAVADVLHDRSRKEVCILENDAQATSEVRLLDLVDVYLVEADLAVLDIIEAVDEVHDSCLACAGASYECKLLAWLCIHLDVMENHLLGVIAEVHAIEGNCTFELAVGYASISLMRMLPGPGMGVFSGLSYCSVFGNICTNKFDIAVVFLRLLIHHFEDSLCTCTGHHDAGELLADLSHRHREALVQAHECD